MSKKLNGPGYTVAAFGSVGIEFDSRSKPLFTNNIRNNLENFSKKPPHVVSKRLPSGRCHLKAEGSTTRGLQPHSVVEEQRYLWTMTMTITTTTKFVLYDNKCHSPGLNPGPSNFKGSIHTARPRWLQLISLWKIFLPVVSWFANNLGLFLQVPYNVSGKPL